MTFYIIFHSLGAVFTKVWLNLRALYKTTASVDSILKKLFINSNVLYQN